MFVNVFYQERIFYFVTLPEKQKANVENANIFSEDHWPLCAWFSHLLSCSLIDLFNHWSHRSWEMTAEGQRLVVACLWEVPLLGGAESSWVMATSHQHIPSLANPKACFFNNTQKWSNPGKTSTCSNLPQNVSNADS